MKKAVIIISLFLLGTTLSVKAQEMTEKEQNNYAIGVLLGQKIQEEIQKAGIDVTIFESIKEKFKELVDLHAIKEGFSDVLKGESKLSKEEVEASLMELMKMKDYFEQLFGLNQTNQVNQLQKSECATSIYSELIQEAWAMYEVEEYPMSAQRYEEAFKTLGGKGLVRDRYNAACSYALANKIDAAFVQLFKIAKRGNYTDFEHITTDADLNALHNDKRWTKLIKIVKANKEKADSLRYVK
ncbi:MAG: hypothetical protein FWD09_00730 [Lentimicrobiaceae bacterium]|nr:hypothetical protein [Lentimicrobiaceae bacterium]